MLDQEIYTLEQIEMVSFHPSDISDKRVFTSRSILITIGGRGEIRLGDKRYQLDQTGCIFFCNPGTELFYTSSDSHLGLILYQLHVGAYVKTCYEGKTVYERRQADLLPTGAIGSTGYHRIRELAETLHRWNQEISPSDPFKVHMYFQEILHLLWRGHEESKLERSENIIDKITGYIDEHYVEDLTRDQLANMAGINQEYFSRLFKRKTGTSFTKYLSEMRIKKAQEYLLTSKASLREIAKSVGYRDEFYLSSKFKQVTGHSPSLYLKKPKRIASVSSNYTACLLALGVIPIVAKMNRFIQEHFREQLESASIQIVDLLTFHYNPMIAKANPDLVLCYDSYQDLHELKRIAPTVAISFSTLSWREQFLMIAELVHAVDRAKEWLRRYDERVAKAKTVIESKIGRTETFGIFEIWKDKIMIFGDSYGRAGQVIYQSLQLSPSEKIREEVFANQRYKIISLDELPQYATDRMFVTVFHEKGGGEYAAKIMESPVWKSLEAYKKQHIYINDHAAFYNWDPISTEYQLKKVVEQLTGETQ